MKIKEFIKLNKPKLIFAYKLLSISFLCILLIFLILAIIFQNQFPDLILFIQIFVFIGIIFPIISLFIAYLSWKNNYNSYQKYVKNKILNYDSNFGYFEKQIFENTKWEFNEKILVKTENGFEIQIYLIKNDIEFWIFAINEEIDKTKLEYFENKFKKLNIKKLFYGGFYLSINRKKLNENNMKEIEINLSKFINLLKEYNFKSVK